MSKKILKYGDYEFEIIGSYPKDGGVEFECIPYTGGVYQCSPFTIKKVVYNDPATIVMWADGTKTVVKCNEGDTFDPEKGLLLCIAKKAYGNTGYFNDVLRENVPEPVAVPDIFGNFIDAVSSFFDGVRKPEQPFDWDAFKSNKITVHCPTREASDDFLRECEKHDVRWFLGHEATYNSEFWGIYERDTTYGFCGNLFFGSINGRDKSEVIEWKVR